MEEFRFSMEKCSFCVGKSHCDSCGADLAELLEAIPGVRRVHMVMKERTMRVDCSLTEDELDDVLERWGVFRV